MGVAADVIVIGGGITGLTAAYHLHTRRLRVTLLEASPRVGGLVRTEHADGFTIEAGADSLLAQKPAAIELCQALGLESQLQGMRQLGAFVLRGARLYPLPRPSILGLPIGWRALARYSLLPPLARMRLALEPLVPPRASDEDESVAAFFRRRFGAATVDLIAQPLLGGIHAGEIEQLSMRALFPRLLEMERRNGHVLTRTGGAPSSASPFVALKDGMSELVRALESRLGESVHLDTRVVRLERTPDGWRAHTRGAGDSELNRAGLQSRHEDHYDARAIILACPAYVAADLLAPIDGDAARLCGDVPYVSTASVALAWRRSDVPHDLSSTGFVVARRHSDVRITACTWVSSKWEHRAPEGMALLRVFLGGAHDPDVVDLDDDALIAIARGDLRRTMGIAAPPALARVFRWRRAGAQHTVGHVDRADAIEQALARHPGLFVAGSGFRSVGIPDCVADARRAADLASAGIG